MKKSVVFLDIRERIGVVIVLSYSLVFCNCLFCKLFYPIPSELCVNPLVVISDNRKTPVKEFHLAPIRTQIPGHKGRQRWVLLMRFARAFVCITPERMA